MTLPDKSEPSVLDYIKSKIFPGKNPVIVIPGEDGFRQEQTPTLEKIIRERPKPREVNYQLLLLFILLIVLLLGQKLLEPPQKSVQMALIFYGSGIIWVIYSWIRRKFETDLYPYVDAEPEEQVFRPRFFYVSLVFGIAATLFFVKNRFTVLNVSLWVIAIAAFVGAFLPNIEWKETSTRFIEKAKRLFRNGFRIQISPWTFTCLVVFALVSFYRFFRLNEVPFEMISDHAEKLLDVYDVLHGAFSIFFIRNTGREAFQMYLSALISLIFGTGISFMTLKLGTAIMGLFTAVYMYFLGKEVGNRYVGLFAFLLCGIGYWPNIISRIGLRFTLYSAFTAPVLFYLFRGLRRKSWMDLVLAGIFTGIGLHGYSPFRVVPVLVFIGVCLYVAHHWKEGHKNFAVYGLIFTGFAALVIFLPLMRYIIDQPDWIVYRTLTRAGELERPLPGPAWQIFLTNLWRASIMPLWDDGWVWVHSIPKRPALDVVSAAMYLLGLVVGILRYIRTRDWRIPFLFISVPFLMLPSIFSLAFPDENPCLNRTAGALVPIFIIAAMGLDTLLHNIKNQVKGKSGSLTAGLVGAALVLISMSQNYSMVFNDYNQTYINKSLNTSEIGSVVKGFVDIYGDPDSAYVVSYPYWVDTRLVGMNAGFPIKDYAIRPEGFNETLSNPRAKMFILNPEDADSLKLLRQLYPDRNEIIYQGRIESKNFIVFLVPASIKSNQEAGTKAP
jgi:hypothetical protein